MASVSTYLNFKRSTEDAFNFYKKIFGTEFVGPIARFGEDPADSWTAAGPGRRQEPHHAHLPAHPGRPCHHGHGCA